MDVGTNHSIGFSGLDHFSDGSHGTQMLGDGSINRQEFMLIQIQAHGVHAAQPSSLIAYGRLWHTGKVPGISLTIVADQPVDHQFFHGFFVIVIIVPGECRDQGRGTRLRLRL